jgi:hypothetical protein
MKNDNCQRMLSAPLLEDMELRMAGGLKCPCCATPVRCDPEPLSDPFAFRVLCTGCHADIISYDRRP